MRRNKKIETAGIKTGRAKTRKTWGGEIQTVWKIKRPLFP